MCSRLDTQLSVLARLSPHLDDDELRARAHDHARSCPECTGWKPAPHLSRDPDADASGGPVLSGTHEQITDESTPSETPVGHAAELIHADAHPMSGAPRCSECTDAALALDRAGLLATHEHDAQQQRLGAEQGTRWGRERNLRLVPAAEHRASGAAA